MSAGSRLAGVDVDLVRGPLANLLVTGVAITSFEDTLIVGQRDTLSATATTTGTPPAIFWTSLDPSVLDMTDSVATAASPGTARVVASAGAHADTVNIVVRPPIGSSGVVITAGNNQSGTVGSALAIPPAVRVLDGLGNPVVGVQVTFAVASGGGTIAGGVQTTSGTGDATAGAWTLGQTAGANTLTATVTGLTPALFTATGNPGPATGLIIVSGNNQTANAGSALPQPLVVEARDQFANAVPSVPISWSVSDGTASPPSGTTGTNGRAQTTWTLGTTAVNQSATATSASLTSPTFSAVATFPTPTVVLSLGPPAIVGVGRTATLNITLSQPAPAGGVTVNVTSANAGTVSVTPPGTAVIAQGGTTGQVTLNGVAAGTTNISGAATGYTTGVLAVTASLNIISLPTTLNVPFGQNASIPVQLATAAPAGGTVVTLTSTNASAVSVVTGTVTVTPGTQLANGTLSGVAPGTASVIASATGYVSDTTAVATTANLNIVETSSALDATFPSTITIRLESGGNQIAAPSGGVQVTLTPIDPTCVAATSPRTIPAGLVNVTSTLSYGGSATLPCTTRVRATAANIVSDSLPVTVSPAPGITLNAVTNVGSGLQQPEYGFLGAAQHGGVSVRVTSSNPAVALVSPNATTPGTTFIDIPLANGSTSFSYYTQGVEGQTGTSNITATATPFTPATPRTLTVVQPALDVIGLVTSFTTLDANRPFQVRIGIAAATVMNYEQAIRAGGTALTATIVNTNGSVAQLVTTGPPGNSVTVGIAAGQARSPGTAATGGVEFDVIGPGTTSVSATIPGFIALPAATVSNIMVTAPGITLNAVTNVGSGLQQPQFGFLGASAHGGVTVRVTSSNPAVLLVSPNATTPGTAFIDIPVANGTTSFSYYTQGVEGQTGTSDITATVTGFTDATPRTGTVVQPALDIISLGTSFTTLDANDAFQVRIGIAAGTVMNYEQVIRAGGTPLTATVVNSNVTAAQLVTTTLTGNSVTVGVAVGQARSPGTVASGGVEFDPLASGSTTVSATIPGFVALPTAAVTVTISAPALSLNATTDVGAGLQQGGQFGSLNAGGHGGITVRLTSSNSSVLLLSPNATTAGTAFIDIPLVNNQTSFTYYTQGVEGASGTASVSAAAPGFIDDIVSVTTRAAAIDIIGLASTTTVAAADDPFQIRTGIAAGTVMNLEQAIRVGGTALTATIANSNATAGQLVTSAGAAQSRTVQVSTGQARSPTTVATGGIAFDALAVGQTTVAIQTAPGFVILPAGSVVVTVN